MAELENNFDRFKNEFTVHTGLDPKTNVDTYIQYYQARILDQMMQQQDDKLKQLIDKVHALDT
jgi:hypothetical protein